VDLITTVLGSFKIFLNMEYKKFTDEYFMSEALKEAKKAFEEDEVPVGSVIVLNNRIISRAHNQTELLKDVTAHSEIMAITTAEQVLGSKYLAQATLYVTLEPCVMCIGAIFWSKISRLVIGASDEKFGYYNFEKILNREEKSLQHPKLEVKKGVLEKECTLLMQEFFRLKRIN
jgi:tRNA(adenine34) deaminase